MRMCITWYTIPDFTPLLYDINDYFSNQKYLPSSNSKSKSLNITSLPSPRTKRFYNNELR